MRKPAVLAGACALLLVVAIFALVVAETGEDSIDAVVPAGARVVARRPVVDGATVLLVSRRDRLQIVVAHKERGGWFATEVDPAPAGASASWVATRGDGPVPALSAVYGRSVGTDVAVEWADGRNDTTQAAAGEPFLVVREGHRRSARVTMKGADGAVVAEVAGP